MFVLHPRLAADTACITESELSSVLLMKNKLFPWLILVPRVAGVSEIIELSVFDRHKLMDEISFASRALQEIFTPDKLNVAALGNQVPQLHVHVIARYKTDSAWPDPVWGRGGEVNALPEVMVKIRDFYERHRQNKE